MTNFVTPIQIPGYDEDDTLGNLITPLSSAPVTSSMFKEKFVSLYEALFAGKELYRKELFWEELFLLRVNSQFLENQILQKSEEELKQITRILHAIFQAALDTTQDSQHHRRTNALQVCHKRVF